MYVQWKANGALYGEEIGYFVIFVMQENIALAAVLGESDVWAILLEFRSKFVYAGYFKKCAFAPQYDWYLLIEQDWPDVHNV